MNLSLNEVEALVKKAARGSGLNWGASAEVARSMRWLVSHQPRALDELLRLLHLNDHASHAEVSPIALVSPWHAPCGRLSAILAGLSVCDVAARLDATPLRLVQVDAPLVMVGLLGRAARTAGVTLAMTSPTARALTDGQGLLIDGQFAPADDLDVAVVAVQALPGPVDSRLTIGAELLDGLGVFCARTYAPATEQSRTTGAGAGVSDND